ncbi:hypothetical protein V8C35DRAFT_288329 [Trichoderma chlorosporum]
MDSFEEPPPPYVANLADAPAEADGCDSYESESDTVESGDSIMLDAPNRIQERQGAIRTQGAIRQRRYSQTRQNNQPGGPNQPPQYRPVLWKPYSPYDADSKNPLYGSWQRRGTGELELFERRDSDGNVLLRCETGARHRRTRVLPHGFFNPTPLPKRSVQKFVYYLQTRDGYTKKIHHRTYTTPRVTDGGVYFLQTLIRECRSWPRGYNRHLHGEYSDGGHLRRFIRRYDEGPRTLPS